MPWVGVAALAICLPLLVRALDQGELAATVRAALADPLGLAAVLLLYALAFALRALVWARVLPGLGRGHALSAIHVSLLGNHVLPLRLGEVLRVTSAVRRAGVATAPATASTVMLRAADVVAVLGLALVGGAVAAGAPLGAWGWLLLAAALAAWGAAAIWLRRLARSDGAVAGLPVPVIALAAVAAWVLESAVMWQAARWAGFELTVLEAIAVTAVTVAAQIVAIAPGGLGTYEAAATVALVGLGAEAGPALAAALVAHAVKTVYALLAGGVALFVPAPGVLGRLRLARPRVRPAEAGPPDGAPVVLFLPAYDEEETVGDVVRRIPATACGRPVLALVVDDGSTDRTAAVARAAGAEVVSLGENRGLGAAVRRGLAEAGARGAAAVAFCDADAEYAPEELERLLAPILAGEADYVVGSRFAGDVHRMLPHRRFGNVVLTRVLSVVARTRVTDGQSGYRAFSAAAAREAEVIHDFNYAQVLTLDLLGKGFRYAEVPISYRFREKGTSFVRLVPYLRNVIPAVHRELNSI